ncbi:hypothetical protein A2115_01680 [Candidatus Woesebacteria bacterium GWA1_41_8]|jgi:putative Holliday junction resolvase|uniref:Putative pre-16S rRNA nuclease n=1 Tax=Candidatus Woesebacteria bacterium GWA1_41_8 TaxID=1802471 RepID=A0A1F7WIY8_9BACT|nr:MAG: hypothetical protein A2115_01680 [Candidatus Woesebacteria bacterium GWA1_41_8]
MRYLGIDYGKKKIGLAVAATTISEVYGTLMVSSDTDALKKIGEVIKKENISEIVVGISEGQMAKDSKYFIEKLKDKFKLPVHMQDETLTSKAAQFLSIQAGIKRKKRKRLEDAYSASLILQNYLDEKA